MITVERDYRSKILGINKEVLNIVQRDLFPYLGSIEREAIGQRRDAWPDRVQDIFRSMRTIAEQPIGRAITVAQGAARDTDIRNLKSVRAQMRAVLQVDVFLNSPRVAASAAAFAQENAALIKSVPARFLDEIESMTLRQFRAGRRASELEPMIMDRFGVSESRAALIARDQISKLNGDLTRERQTDLGIKAYTWRTSGDERVRPSHQANNGKTFMWNDPPAETGHPGEDYQCRCHPEPILADLLD